MAGIVKRLQELIEITSATTQDKLDAADLLLYGTTTIVVRKPVAGATGTLTIENAAPLDDDSFVATSTTFDLTSTTTEVKVLTSPLRYVRWSITAVTGSPQFMVDLVARDN